jgi:outer membrane protein TolC
LAQQIVVNRNQLNALVADDFMEEIDIHPIDLPLVPVPQDIRLNLLSHRPDVTAQLWRIQRVSKQIAVAEKSFYPNINFAGYMGYSTILFSKWFKNESIYDQYGPAWNLPLFDAGKRYFDLREQEAQYTLAVEQYNELMTQAVQEVLEALETLQVIVQRLKESASDEESAQSVLTINMERVKHNLGTQIDVINSRINLDNARELTLQLKAMYLDQLLNLIKALGGCNE